jgi:hypothetical protein
MRIWAVLYIMGKAGLAVGPLPYGMEECKIRTAEKTTEIANSLWNSDDQLAYLIKEFPGITKQDIVMSCVESRETPVLNLK